MLSVVHFSLMPIAIPETPPCVMCLSAGDATGGGGLAAGVQAGARLAQAGVEAVAEERLVARARVEDDRHAARGVHAADRRVERELGRYNSEIANLRLMARGIDPQLMQPIDVQIQDQATPDSRGGTFLGIASLSIILTLFYAAMNLAIDTSAGERERNSLTLLLSQPLSSLQLVLAKIVAIACFSMLGLVVILLVLGGAAAAAYMLGIFK